MSNLPWVKFWKKNSDIQNDSVVDRFVFTKKGNIQPGFFMDRDGGDISVFETKYLPEERCWKIGQKVNPNVSVKARCRIKVSDVRALKDDQYKYSLTIKRSPETALKHSFVEKWWHANISNCPPERENYKLMALALCEKAEYIKRVTDTK